MKLKYIFVMSCVSLSIGMQAQTVDEVLSQIERNNKELQAQEQTIRASKLEVQAENNLEDPSVEYSPFYTRGISGMSSSELVVTQGFDFPTLYAARRQSGKWKQEVLDRQLRIFRRDILLNAKNLCLDLILYNQKQTLLVQRKKNADELLVLFEKRLKEGDVGVLDETFTQLNGLNLYAYCYNNPVMMTDPDGAFALTWWQEHLYYKIINNSCQD